MADNSISIKVQADVAQAQRALRDIVDTAKSSGREITQAEKDAIQASALHVKKLKEVEKAQKATGQAGVTAQKSLKTEIEKSGAAIEKLSKTTAAVGKNLTASTQQIKQKFSELKAEVVDVDKKSGGLQATWGKLIGAWVGFQGAMAAGGLIAAVEEMDRLDARLKISEGSAQAAATAMDEIKRVATDTRAPVKEVADAYIRFSTAIQRAGGSQKQSIQFTELLSKALKVSGASATQVGNTMLQLGQAFQSGALQGDEFRSVAENGGMVLNYLADSLGVTRGELKKMSADGELTAEKLLKLVDAADAINRDFAKVPKTAGEAFVLVSNAFLDVAQKSTALKLIIQGLGEILIFAAKNMAALVSTGIIAGLTAIIISAGGITAAFSAAAAAVASLRVALLSLASANPWLLAFAAAATYVVWQWEAIKKAILYVMDLLGIAPETVAIDKTTEAVAELERQIREMEGKLGPALEAVKKQIDDQRKAATASVKAITSAYSAMASQIDNNASDQLRIIRERYAEEKRLIASTQGDTDARYREEASALIAATQQQIEILKDSARQKTQLIDEEYTIASQATRVMFDNERERAQALQALDNEVMQKKRTVLAQMLTDYRSHIDALNSEAQRNFDAIKAIEDQKRGLTSSTQDRIRALQQSAMGEYAAYQDKLKQIDELNAKARAAITEGQSEQAVEYAKKAQDIASGIASGIKENGKEIVTQANATAVAINKMTESESIALSALESRKNAHQQAAQAAQAEAQSVSTSMSEIAAKLQAVNAQVSQGLEITINSNVDQVLADIQQLQGLIQQRDMMLIVESNIGELKAQVDEMKSDLERGTVSNHEIDDNAKEVQRAIDRLKLPTHSYHTIYEKRVPLNSNGGLIQGYANGGQAFRRMVGRIRGAGTATSDSIRAMLSNGEFVTRARATSIISRMFPGFMERLNAISSPADLMRILGRFAAPQIALAGGGAVNVPVPFGGASETMNLNLRFGDVEVPTQTRRANKALIKQFSDDMNRHRLVRGE